MATGPMGPPNYALTREYDLAHHYGQVQAAFERVKGAAHRTPLLTSSAVNEMVAPGAKCFFKGEHVQKIGAFKIRGATNAISQLSEEQKARGVITHSSGNHAQAVALGARNIGVKAKIVMPTNAPPVKVAATKGYGADVVMVPAAQRQSATDELVSKHGFTFIHPSNDLQVIYGQGTATLEVMVDTQGVDVMILPVGGGGLIAGSAIAAKGFNSNCLVVGVEPETADDAFRSIRDGKIYPATKPTTVADGLRTCLGPNNFPLIQKYVDEIVLVSEDEIVDAMQIMFERMKCAIEPSGAVAFAGALKMGERLKGLKVGIMICGGNVDMSDYFNGLRKNLVRSKM